MKPQKLSLKTDHIGPIPTLPRSTHVHCRAQSTTMPTSRSKKSETCNCNPQTDDEWLKIKVAERNIKTKTLTTK